MGGIDHNALSWPFNLIFSYTFGQVPRIILMLSVGVVSFNEEHYTSMPVCSYSRDINMLYHQFLNTPS